jgi:hypothetical protein
MKCPECKATVGPDDIECKQCGMELDAPPPPPPPRREMSDGSKYGIIVGVLLVGAVILVLIAGSMSSSVCKECKGKGVVSCFTCKGGKDSPKCLWCKGTGSDPQTFSTCEHCRGTGGAQQCPKCQGRGKWTCPSCGGEGKK